MSTLKTRFDGPDGQRRLIDVLRTQRIVEYDEALATLLADKGDLTEYDVGAAIVVQDEPDNDVFFIVEGLVEVEVNGQVVATRCAGECIGEMAAIDPSVRRSATVRATEVTLVLKLTEPNFQAAIISAPSVWKRLALVLAERLRQRERFHRVPNPIPILFVGSSVEGLPIASEIVEGLKHDNVIARQWSNPGVFTPGGISIDTLVKEVELADFAAMVFGPDDQVASRKDSFFAPRDNVVFELGLFMGRLDRNRALVIKEHGSEIKIPTDLLGVTPITYVKKPGADLATTISPVCNAIRKLVKELGRR